MSVSFDALVERVEQLERRDGIAVSDLPLAELQRKLESSWQPDGARLLQPRSVDRETLNFRIGWGTGTVTFTTTASAVSAAIPHELGTTPAVVVATARRTADTRDDYLITLVSRDVTNLVFAGRATVFEHFGITNPTVVTFHWIAVA